MASGNDPAEGSNPSNTRSTIAKNAAYNLIGQVLLLGLGLLSAHFVLRGLGHDAFGLILFAATFTAVLSGVFELGVIATTVRAIAVHANDSNYLAGYVRTSSCLYWGTYVVLVAIGYLLAPTIVSNWVHLTDMSAPVAVDGLRLLLIGSFTVLPRNLYASLFRGFQRTEFTTVIEIATSTIQQIGTVAILVRGGGLLAVAAWMLLICAVALTAYVAALSRLLPPLALLPGFSRRIVRDHWKFAANASSNSVLMMLFVQSDKLAVSKLMALSSFGYYSFVWTSVWRIASLTTVVSQAALPSLASLFQSRETLRLRSEYERFHHLVCYGAAVPIAATAFVALPTLSYLFSEGVAYTLLVPIALLGLASYMYATVTMPMALATATGHPELMTKVNLFAAFTFLPTLVLLVASWGLIGAGVAWLAYYGLVYVYFVPRVCRLCLGTAPRRWYGDIARVYLKLFGTYGAAWIICFTTSKGNSWVWCLGFACATFVFLVLVVPRLNKLGGHETLETEPEQRIMRTTEE
ncbi:MAG: hypothetical protein DLM67_02985 [Candidatus Nephthysia bennettiae]|nr:MAG: hypothetical protein DLM67_02985 [Candidatus Dormibacteraeota bacterium]